MAPDTTPEGGEAVQLPGSGLVVVEGAEDEADAEAVGVGSGVGFSLARYSALTQYGLPFRTTSANPCRVSPVMRILVATGSTVTTSACCFGSARRLSGAVVNR